MEESSKDADSEDQKMQEKESNDEAKHNNQMDFKCRQINTESKNTHPPEASKLTKSLQTLQSLKISK